MTSSALRETRPAASGSVLRFQSDELTLDLADWPDDWFTLGDADLLNLLRRATTPTFAPPRRLTPAFGRAQLPDDEPTR